MVKISSASVTQADWQYLAAHLRASDLDELMAVTDLSPQTAVYQSCLASDHRFLTAWFADQQLLGIAGCSPYLGGAAPWLLGTDALQQHLFSLTRQAKLGIADMLQVYPWLSNVIDARQIETIRWLTSLGFVIENEQARKPAYPLLRFTLKKGP